MGHPVAATGRILLEEVRAADEAELLASVAASRALHHPWVDAPDSAARFTMLVERVALAEHHTFLVRAADDGVLAGVVNVTNIVRGAFHSAFTGYYAFVAGAGRGLMTDGIGAVIDHAFDSLQLHRLEANIQPDNLRSIALAERCGYRYEGFSPRYLFIDGAWRDHNRYALTVEDRPLR